MPRFVVLEHDHPFLHWDLMLEAGEALRTWRLRGVPGPAKGPAGGASQPIIAEPLPDHRLAYLDYEGPVSGERGRVKRFDAGAFEWVEDVEGRCVIELDGRVLLGRAELTETSNGGWEFIMRGTDEI